MRRLAVAIAVASTSCVLKDVVAITGGGSNERDAACAARLATPVFQHALCGCGPVSFSPDIVVDSFDSRAGPWAPDGGGGDVGANSGLRFAGSLVVGGNLIVATGGVEAGLRLDVGGDLRVAGSLGRPSSKVRVSGSAEIGGDVDVSALDVAGALSLPASASVNASERITALARTSGTVTVERPCRCEADGGVDVAGLIDRHQQDNDDEAMGLSPTAYASFAGDETVNLSSGVAYLERIHGSGSGKLTLHVTGHASLFVRAADAPLAVQLDDGADLDLFVDGPITFASGALGAPTRPSALRIFSVNAGPIDLNPAQLSGYLYAPGSDLTASVTHEVYGGLVVGNVVGGWGGSLVIHHDRAVASLDTACP